MFVIFLYAVQIIQTLHVHIIFNESNRPCHYPAMQTATEQVLWNCCLVGLAELAQSLFRQQACSTLSATAGKPTWLQQGKQFHVCQPQLENL